MARKSYKGKFIPEFPGKYAGKVNDIVFRSLWERKFFIWADRNPSVLKWGSEEVVIPYYSTVNQKMRRYFTDAVVSLKCRDGEVRTYLIEIKPHKETIPPVPPKRKTAKSTYTYQKACMTWKVNQDKWEAATAYAKKRGMIFIIMTEYELGIKKKT